MRTRIESMVKIAAVVNMLLTAAAISLSLFVQQMTPAMVRHANFTRFRDRVSDEDRDAILHSAAEVVWISNLPLIVIGLGWITIWLAATLLKSPVKTQDNA